MGPVCLNLGGSAPTGVAEGGVSATKGFDPSALIGMAFSIGLGLIVSGNEASKVRQLQRYIDRLTKEQKADLEEKLAQTKDEVLRMKVVYEFLVEADRAERLRVQKQKRLTALAVLGGSVVLLGVVILIAKAK